MPRTQIEKLWLAGAGLAGLLLIVVSYFFFIGPQRNQTSSVNAQVSSAKAQNDQLRARIAMLQGQNKDLAKYQAQLSAAERALPTTSGLPDFLRTLQAMGNATNTNITSMEVSAPADVTAVAFTQPQPRATSSTSTSGSVNGKVGASVNGARVYALPITAEIAGTPEQLTAFLTQLQQVQPRAVLISAIDEKASMSGAPGTKSGTTTTVLTLTMQAFVAPASAAEGAQLASAAHR
jgi:Tfp pilus assembly protein PilO